MKSLKELYKIGRGPSSSHTIGPQKACRLFLDKNKNSQSFKVILFGSLAKTGKGHRTDYVIKKTFAPKECEVIFDTDKNDLPHPNTMEITAIYSDNKTDFMRVMSVGGGAIKIEGDDSHDDVDVYSLNTFTDIFNYCRENDIKIWQYAVEEEGDDILVYLTKVWETMKKSIYEGLRGEGVLPGAMSVQRKAKYLYDQIHIDESAETRENRIVCAYAFAVREQNACGEEIVTAPTCGSAGVLPAVLLYQQQKKGYSDEDIVKALITAGVFGNLIKTNASISGAECGCQAEIGSACSMASAALGELLGLLPEQIEYAAEIAMKHHLELTCDPIHGLVQIPCIERNAVVAMRAINSVSLANFLSDTRKISFDLVVETMYQTGKDMSSRYRETSEGGLAKLYI